ncbi:hypothetical protein [Tenacibaculum sp.]|uniref:hypothetical protein n=1 Tax=Tenacibaculum sp. TaxID=1906242 RepID=UPI003AA85678
MEKKYKKFGEIIIKKFRDENYANYLKSTEQARKITINEYYNLKRNENYDSNLQKIEDERFEFINSLSGTQKEQLDKLILKTLDDTAFNFLREIEEDFHFNESVGLIFKGKSIEDIYDEFLSGTFFGEYFLWINKFSKYGDFQY